MLEVTIEADRWIEFALKLASKANSSPNPRVGCVLISPTGELLGADHTQPVGGPHAEIAALQKARAQGLSTAGATAYVTLEPCSHHGRTGPCCEALISAGIRRVVTSLEDPNPLVAGRGIQRLRDAGIEVEVGPGAEQSRELNLGFLQRMTLGRPWIRVKIAASIDGKTALPNGASQWITSEAARLDGHEWRAKANVILTGIGTVLHDDPILNVRLENATRQPHIAVIDGRLSIPLQSRLFVEKRPVYIYTASDDIGRKEALEARGATVILCPDVSDSNSMRVDLRAVMTDLAKRECNELHVEAGSKLNGALLDAGLVDELLIYLAPKWMGPGRSMAESHPLQALEQAIPLEIHSLDKIGNDVRLVLRTGKSQPLTP